MTANIRHLRSALTGAGVGAALATALHLWMLYATHVARLPHEGTAFLAYFGAVLLGMPINLLPSILPIGLPVMVEYTLLLAGIVVNWSLAFWAWSRFRRRPSGA